MQLLDDPLDKDIPQLTNQQLIWLFHQRNRFTKSICSTIESEFNRRNILLVQKYSHSYSFTPSKTPFRFSTNSRLSTFLFILICLLGFKARGENKFTFLEIAKITRLSWRTGKSLKMPVHLWWEVN